MSLQLIQSPLNYTGGKFRLLPQLLQHFPTDISTFIDLFCGGANVGININAPNIIFNDSDKNVIQLLHTIIKTETIFSEISNLISKYNFSHSAQYGYEYYGCKSSEGLAPYNRQPYLNLRSDFNIQNDDYIKLFALIVFAFNNQIRFNSKGEFNLPVGKRDFNRRMQQKLSLFSHRLNENPERYQFQNNDFRNFDASKLASDSFIYCDPPYLITCATYCERNAWTAFDENDLYDFLDTLNNNQIRFALSNVLESKGSQNLILNNWAKKYRIIPLEYNYANSNYHKQDKSRNAQEVLIVNY